MAIRRYLGLWNKVKSFQLLKLRGAQGKVDIGIFRSIKELILTLR